MASIESEVLDPAIERFRKAASELALSRRSFMGLGVAGAAAVAGAGLLSTSHAVAQEPLHNGYPQVDVLNFLLQIKYVTATLYSYLTQGVDLPPASGATVGTAQVFNAPSAKVAFSTQQITDLFNEMYYEELSHVVDLRNLIQSASPGQPVGGTAVVGRANLNLLGNSAPAATPASATAAWTASQAIAYARLLEDLSVSAAAGATAYLSGTNLAYVTQMMAADGFHAGAVRLVAIQTNSQLQGSLYQFLGVTTSAETAVTMIGNLVAANSAFYATLVSAVVVPSAGQAVSGPNVPQGAVIKSLVGNPAYVGAVSAGTNLVTGLSSVTNLAVGQFIVGYDASGNSLIPAGTTITAISTTAPFTLTLSNTATATSAAATVSVLINTAITGNITSASNQVTALSSVAGLAAGQPISGTGIAANSTITAVNTAAASLTLSANATATTAKLAITVSTTLVTLTKTLPTSGFQTLSVIQPDNLDVQPGDNGSASNKGPAAVSGSSPAVYQGFFNTAGSGTAGATGTQAGLVMTRNFSQVLQVLLDTNATNTLVTNQSSEGGFYPFGVSGTINSIQPF